MRTKCLSLTVLACFQLISCTFSVVLAGSADHKQEAKQILDATGVKGGLIVHIGCGDGKLTGALRMGDCYLVHGLDTDAEKVQQARRYIRSLKEYGKVSAEEFDGKRLPYRSFPGGTDGHIHRVPAI